MFQNFILKQLLKRKMKDVPAEQQEKIFKMIEENPQFFEKVAAQVKKKMDGGMAEQEAMLAVMRENQDELRSIMK